MIPSSESPDAIMYLHGRVSNLQDFIELRWMNYPWEHEEDKVLVDGLKDIMVMLSKIRRIDAEVSRDPIHGQAHDP